MVPYEHNEARTRTLDLNVVITTLRGCLLCVVDALCGIPLLDSLLLVVFVSLATCVAWRLLLCRDCCLLVCLLEAQLNCQPVDLPVYEDVAISFSVPADTGRRWRVGFFS